MSEAVKCPVCFGSGKFNPYPNDPQTTDYIPPVCHGCNGKGWVEVGGHWPTQPYMSPQPYNPTPQIWYTTCCGQKNG